MKRNILYLIFIIVISSCTYRQDAKIERVFNKSAIHYSNLLRDIGGSKMIPRSIKPDGEVRLVKPNDWTSGFFPGCLWLQYEHSGEQIWKERATQYTNKLASQQYNGNDHDIGFKMYCSYGNAYRLTNDSIYKNILVNSAKTLSTRFNKKVGCIRSWDHHANKWQFPVIIDNLMNLELLFWATNETGDSSFYKIAQTHALTTLKNHFRKDYSSYHVVNYDTITGEVLCKQTHQGYADNSTWARGQAWGLYGYAMCYRETKDGRFLKQAEEIANFLIQHPRLPKDNIPYWDFDAPDIPNAPRDASAAAVICSGLYELSKYSKYHEKYIEFADEIYSALSSDRYCTNELTQGAFLLKHSVGNKPKNDEVDVSIVYGDYYFLEAGLRRLKYAE